MKTAQKDRSEKIPSGLYYERTLLYSSFVTFAYFSQLTTFQNAAM